MAWWEILVAAAFLGVTSAAGYWTALWKGRPQNRIAWAVGGALLAILLPLFLMFRSGPEEKRVRRPFVIPLIVVANVLVILQVAAFLFVLAYQGTTGLPLCNSQAAHDQAKAAFANSPVARRTGIAIEGIFQVQEAFASDVERRCVGTAFLNNGSEREVAYSLKLREGQMFIEVEVR
jgi:hypothetical protein